MLVSASILPHGSMLLNPALSGLPAGAVELHHACHEAAAEIMACRPDLIVLLTPHGVALQDAVNVYLNERVSGTAAWLGEWAEHEVHKECDAHLAKTLMHFLQQSGEKKAASVGEVEMQPAVHAEGCVCVAPSLPAPVGWGEAVPLHFLQQQQQQQQQQEEVPLTAGAPFQAVVASWPRARHSPVQYAAEAVEVGRRVCEYVHSLRCMEGGRGGGPRVALVCSADLSHVHGTPKGVASVLRGDDALLGEPNAALAGRFDALVVHHWAKGVVRGDLNASREVLFGRGGRQRQQPVEQGGLGGREGERIAAECCVDIVESAKACGWAGICAMQGCLERHVELHGDGKPRLREGGGDGDVHGRADESEGVSAAMDQGSLDGGAAASAHSQGAALWTGRVHGYDAPTYYGMMAMTVSIKEK